MNTLRRAWKLPSAKFAIGVLLVVAVVAIFGRWLAPQDSLGQDTTSILQGPSSSHWFGTDYLGRDVLSRLIDGTGRSVFSALEAVLIGMVIGVPAGLASVVFSRAFEWISLRVVDALMTLPFIVFAVAVTGIIGNSVHASMFAVGVVLSPLFFRVTRSSALTYTSAQYVETAELLGASKGWILRVHLWSKVLPTIAVTTAGAIAMALLVVSSLTFLGIGVQPPTPTWGGMLSSDLAYLSQSPYAPLVPAVVIMLTVGALNLLADAIRDVSGDHVVTTRAQRRARRRIAAESLASHRSHESTLLATADSAEPTPLVDVRGLRISVGGGTAEAVRGVDLQIRRGEAVGLVGESGSGKTLTCRSLLGVLAPGCEIDGGSIRFDDIELTSLRSQQWAPLRGTRIGAVFQDPASYLNPSLTVGQQLSEVLRVKLGRSHRQAHAEALELFAQMGLHDGEHVYHQYPHELSGGMLQRVLIAIAVSCDPELLIADEATTALDVTIQAEVLELIAKLRVERNLAVLAVSHDLAVIAQLCDRVVVFYAGEVVESGTTEEILQRPQHPYTAALLRVATVSDWEKRDLEVIPGQAPAVGEQIQGCRFAARCGFATDACRTSDIPLATLPGGREVRCIRAAELSLAPSDPRELGALV